MPVTFRNNTAAISGASGAAGSGKPEFVTAANFKEKVLQGQGPIAVEFMSYACGHCRQADPMVNDIAEALRGKVTVYKVNVPKDQALAAQYGIHATPTMVMFRDGREQGRDNPDINIASIRRVIVGAFDDVQ